MITAGKECEDCRYYEPIDKFYSKCTARDKKYHYGQWVPCNDKLPLLDIPEDYKGLGKAPDVSEEVIVEEEGTETTIDKKETILNEKRYKANVKTSRSRRKDSKQ